MTLTELVVALTQVTTWQLLQFCGFWFAMTYATYVITYAIFRREIGPTGEINSSKMTTMALMWPYTLGLLLLRYVFVMTAEVPVDVIRSLLKSTPAPKTKAK